MNEIIQWKRDLIHQFALAAVAKGFEAFVAESGTHGFYTNGERVVSFQIDYSSITLSGNYEPHHGGGSGWRIGNQHENPFDLIEAAIKANAPSWATKKPDLKYRNKEQYLAAYQDSSRFTQVTAD